MASKVEDIACNNLLLRVYHPQAVTNLLKQVFTMPMHAPWKDRQHNIETGVEVLNVPWFLSGKCQTFMKISPVQFEMNPRHAMALICLLKLGSNKPFISIKQC